MENVLDAGEKRENFRVEIAMSVGDDANLHKLREALGPVVCVKESLKLG